MAETEPRTETLQIREALNRALHQEMARDENVFLMGEDVSQGMFGVTTGLVDEFGEDRVRDTPISEAGFVGAGVGAAATGARPIVDMGFVSFLGVAFEQVHNQMAQLRYMFGGKIDVPITVRAAEGAGQRAAAQHSKTLHTVFAHLPGTYVAAPGTPRAAMGLQKAAIRSDDPVFLFEHKLQYQQEGEVPTDEDFTVPLGEASVERAGSDVTVVATQRYVSESLSVAEELAGEIDIGVIDLRTVYPIDTETITESLAKTGRLVVADESPLSYGTHAEILARAAESAFWDLDAPLQRVGVPDTPIPFSPAMEDEVVPAATDVRQAIERTV